VNTRRTSDRFGPASRGGGWDSNPRPPGPQPGALPTELPPPREDHRIRGATVGPGAPVAQGTEQRTSNPRVGGSNPPRRKWKALPTRGFLVSDFERAVRVATGVATPWSEQATTMALRLVPLRRPLGRHDRRRSRDWRRRGRHRRRAGKRDRGRRAGPGRANPRPLKLSWRTYQTLENASSLDATARASRVLPATRDPSGRHMRSRTRRRTR
jgi:hypothetical protein